MKNVPETPCKMKENKVGGSFRTIMDKDLNKTDGTGNLHDFCVSC